MPRYPAVLLLTRAPALARQYTIPTIAGQGVSGVVFNYPTGVAVDPAGDLYLSDWSGYIRKVWVKDRITTIVAGTGVLR